MTKNVERAKDLRHDADLLDETAKEIRDSNIRWWVHYMVRGIRLKADNLERSKDDEAG